jgi:hypothetical protein
MQVEGRNRHAYNAQAIADEQEGVIVACAATRQETDSGQLVPMIQQARENLGPAATQTLTVADTGYGAGADLQAAAERQMPVLAPPAEGKPGHENPYATARFNYDPAAQTLPCPRGEQLDHEGHTTREGVRVDRYRCHCRDLPGARAMHARPQRPAGGSVAAHRGSPKDARAPARTRAEESMAAEAGDHQAALWAEQTTRRLPAVDGGGAGERAHPMERALRDVEPADTLAAVADRAKSPPPEGGGRLGRRGENKRHGQAGLLEQLRPGGKSVRAIV